MAYIGNPVDTAFTSLLKQDLTGASGTSLTLTHAVANANDIALYINNVRQEPTEAYSVSGTTVTLTGSVSNSDDIYVIYLARAVQTTVPPDGSVSTAKIADTAVTNAKIANSTIDLTTKVTGTLPSANGGSFSTASFKAVIGSSNLTPSTSTPQIYTDVTSATHGCHNIGSHYSTTTGKFIIPVTGVYFFQHSVLFSNMGSGDSMTLHFYKTDADGSSNATEFYQGVRKDYAANSTAFGDGYMHGESNTTGYFTAGQAIYAASQRTGSTPVVHAGSNGSGKRFSFFLGYRIG